MSECTTITTCFDAPSSECLLLAAGLDGRTVLHLKHMLQRLHFFVRVAGSARDALDMAARHRPVLLLGAAEAMEQLMPRLHKRLDAEAMREMALLAILREGSPEQVLKLMMAGADECLVWPLSRQMLARRLGTLAQFA